jgi:hypothetical protein
VNEKIVQTLPNMASLIVVSSCDVYWLATMSDNLYFLASESIVANDLVAKFWNSSIYR